MPRRQGHTPTFMPAMTADAGLVPWADTGMMHTLRCLSPRALQQVHMQARIQHIVSALVLS
jgi:hypothetical protein